MWLAEKCGGHVSVEDDSQRCWRNRRSMRTVHKPREKPPGKDGVARLSLGRRTSACGVCNTYKPSSAASFVRTWEDRPNFAFVRTLSPECDAAVWRVLRMCSMSWLAETHGHSPKKYIIYALLRSLLPKINTCLSPAARINLRPGRCWWPRYF